MQISVSFSFLGYTESELTITPHPHIVKEKLGKFIKKSGQNPKNLSLFYSRFKIQKSRL